MTDDAAQNQPTPKPKPVPRPPAGAGAPSPAKLAGTKTAAPAPVPPQDRSAEIAEAVSFGRVAEDSTVYVRTDAGERPVGQYPDATAEQALEYFARKYLEVVDAAALLQERLTAGASGDSIRASAVSQREALGEAKAVGDLSAVEAKLREIEGSAAERAAEQAKEREAAKSAGLAARTAVVEEAEAIAATDPARMQWKQSGARLNDLFGEWKQIQSTSPRLPRSQDQELWGRFSKARNIFDKRRREFFSDLDKRNAEGKRIKEELVTEAEALSESTDWRGTSQKYRELMDRWKAAPRAGRREDDALWARFRAAQDVFFAARNHANDAIDAEYSENLAAKEELLKRAQALLPVTDIQATKDKLRAIQDEWEAAGKVPRADVSRMEGGLRAVERALAEAEAAEWDRTNPETRARTSGALAQLEDAIAELESKLAAAQAGGNAAAIEKAQAALDARRAWYEQLSKTAAELS
ncbi:hypothetical protein GCM10022261_29210 [Brevibacterium daeguense]|uniref:DUF349 domain-containing protein n=1 Tax=Brevibacterium daeguense TaxID=909936 RepID=A0ABP8EN89_9MICO|nr:DUF349 domain-containing protein [Brevibacterium daeguense]